MSAFPRRLPALIAGAALLLPASPAVGAQDLRPGGGGDGVGRFPREDRRGPET